MRRSVIITLSVIVLMIISITGFYYVKNSYLNNQNENLINITELDEEFMETYFEESEKIKESDNKDNVLIVTSSEEIKDSYGAKVVSAPNNQYILQYDTKEEKDKALEELNKNEDIASVEENLVYQIMGTFNSWGIERMGLDYGSQIVNEKDLDQVTVAIIDTGCDLTLFNSAYPGKISETYNALDNSAVTDTNGHGTHIAGTIAEGTPSNVKIMPMKVSNDGSMYSSDIIEAINYVVYYNKADVINMSFGGYGSSDGIRQAIEAANNANIICVAAAGNDNTSAYSYPAAYDTTISIASVDSTLTKSSFSNYGSTVTFTAPGTSIRSINGYMSGTSMATPHAVAAVAILKSFNPNYSKNEVIEALKKYSIDLGATGRDNYYGYGFINFVNVPFCTSESANCDSLGVFEEEVIEPINKIEVPTVTLTTYNYGSITNLLINTQIRLYDGIEAYTNKYLWELEGLELVNYDPFSTANQTITVNYNGLTTTFTLTQSEAYVASTNLGWTYSDISPSEISLNTFNDENEITHIVVPSTIDGKTVTTLGEQLFFETSIEKAILPISVSDISKQAFSGSNLKNITISSPTIKVGEEAFANLSRLETINSSIVSLSDNAFLNCISLDNITLDSSLTSIGTGAFSGCTNLMNVTIPSGVETIGASAFKNTNIKTLNIPSGVTTILSDTFSGCVNLDTLTLPVGLTTIGSNAFKNTNITVLNIPKNVSSIGDCAFCDNASLTGIVVDPDNTTYDSRNNSNAIIEKSTNKLLIGTGNTVIPNTVKIIGSNAFANSLTLSSVPIPTSVVEIQEKAFYNCDYLEQVIVPQSVVLIGTNAFGGIYGLVMWVYHDSYAQTYAINNSIAYRCLDPTTIGVTMASNTYKAFETVNTEGLKLTLNYDDGRVEYITTGYTISYSGTNTSFRYGDTYFTIAAKTVIGLNFQTRVNVTINKATPTYTIPTGLTAIAGQTLSEIALPQGFTWMDETTVISGSGNIVYKAKYTPEDDVNYETISNIDINILVEIIKTVVTPNISLSAKTYDGTNEIDISTITISNLESTLYTIESATSSAIVVGNTKASIKVKLTNEAFVTYSFASNMQEAIYSVDLVIVHAKVLKPTKVDKVYTYNGFSQEIELNNYVDRIMGISNNARTNAGNQDVTISLTNDNYQWTDGGNGDVIINFNIEKANVNYAYTSSNNNVKYDGNKYGINLVVTGPSEAKVKYMDSSGNYSLDTMPKYSQVGTYVIKYKLYIDNNYMEKYGEQILTITEGDVTNNSIDYVGIYDGDDHSINFSVNVSHYTVRYSINNLNYDLLENPKFKNVGEYTVNYQISGEGFKTFIGSNKVKIYGIESFDSTMELKDEILIVKNQNYDFTNIASRIKTFSTSCAYTHYDKNKVLITENETKTGDIVLIYINNTKKYEYPISLLGDINSDGKVTSGDYVKIKKHIMQTELITDNIYFYASDVNDDGKISSSDYVKIRKYIMNGESL